MSRVNASKLGLNYTPIQAHYKRKWALERLEYHHAQWLEVERDERMSAAVRLLLGMS